MLLSTDPVARRLTADGDIDVSSGRTALVAGIEGFTAGAQARLQLVRGELFTNRRRGMPYLENRYVPARDALLGSSFDERKVRAAFRDALSDTPGFDRLLRLEVVFDAKTRRAAVTWQARTVFGDTPITTSEIGG